MSPINQPEEKWPIPLYRISNQVSEEGFYTLWTMAQCLVRWSVGDEKPHCLMPWPFQNRSLEGDTLKKLVAAKMVIVTTKADQDTPMLIYRLTRYGVQVILESLPQLMDRISFRMTEEDGGDDDL